MFNNKVDTISQEGGLHVNEKCWTLDIQMFCVPLPYGPLSWMTSLLYIGKTL